MRIMHNIMYIGIVPLNQRGPPQNRIIMQPSFLCHELITNPKGMIGTHTHASIACVYTSICIYRCQGSLPPQKVTPDETLHAYTLGT